MRCEARSRDRSKWRLALPCPFSNGLFHAAGIAAADVRSTHLSTSRGRGDGLPTGVHPPRCFVPTPLLAVAAEQQQQEEEKKEEDVSKRRLGRVEAAGLLDGLIDALRLQQVIARVSTGIDDQCRNPKPHTNLLYHAHTPGRRCANGRGRGGGAFLRASPTLPPLGDAGHGPGGPEFLPEHGLPRRLAAGRTPVRTVPSLLQGQSIDWAAVYGGLLPPPPPPPA